MVMNPIRESIWEMAPHTRAKHEILRRYFEAWLPILSKWAKSIHYIDGFAGPGIYKGGEPGSPIIVLQSAIQHRLPIEAEVRFIFIEADAERFRVLNNELKKFENLPPNFHIETYKGRFGDLEEEIDRIHQQGKVLGPTLAFIDPFGFAGFPMRLVHKILRNPSCEVFITFVVRDLDRFSEFREDRVLELYGSDDWKRCQSIEDPTERRQCLIREYEKQLRAGGAEYVLPFEMADEHGNTIYYLVYGTKHLKGMEVMKNAMLAVDKSMNYRFADLVPQEQRRLMEFGLEDTWIDLAAQDVWRRFSGSTVTVEEVGRYVCGETIYPFRKSILKKLTSFKPPAIEYVDKPKRRGTFPNDIQISFDSLRL
jgi:three-Cys-motif partner protein